MGAPRMGKEPGKGRGESEGKGQRRECAGEEGSRRGGGKWVWGGRVGNGKG